MLRSVLTLDQVQAMSADDAAAFWLVRQDSGEDARDDILFQQWLDADPANGRAWARACSLWQDFEHVDEADAEALRQVAIIERPAWSRWKLAAAASIALVAITSGALYLGGGIGGSPGPDGAPTQVAGQSADPSRTFATAAGERRTITLTDSSAVTLNTDSAVAIAYGPGGRQVRLVRGQAFFVVAHDPGRPFTVENAGRTVTAIGTRFEVRAEGRTLRVILVEGRVRVVAPAGGRAEAVELDAGQQLVADASGVNVSAGDVTSVSDWQQGLVTFRDTRLADAAAELNRYTRGKRLLVRDPALAGIRVSGAFHTDDLGRFARTTAEIYPVRVVETAGTIEIVSAR